MRYYAVMMVIKEDLAENSRSNDTPMDREEHASVMDDLVEAVESCEGLKVVDMRIMHDQFQSLDEVRVDRQIAQAER